jgi:histidinol-phosphate aminotransferase
LRIGYAVASPELANLLHKVRPMYEVNTLAIYFVERMLDYSQAMLSSVKRVNAGKADFLAAMADLGFMTFRAEGNFLHVAFGDRAPGIHEALKKVVLYRLDFNDPCLKGYSRFSAAPIELLRPVILAIRQAVGKS